MRHSAFKATQDHQGIVSGVLRVLVLFSDRIQASGQSVLTVALVSDPLQVPRAIVGFLAVDVVDAGKTERVFDECLRHHAMHKLKVTLVVVRQRHPEVALAVRASLQDAASDQPSVAVAATNPVIKGSNAPGVAGFVVAAIARHAAPLL